MLKLVRSNSRISAAVFKSYTHRAWAEMFTATALTLAGVSTAGDRFAGVQSVCGGRRTQV